MEERIIQNLQRLGEAMRPTDGQDVVLLVVPFVAITLVSAAAMFLLRDLLFRKPRPAGYRAGGGGTAGGDSLRLSKSPQQQVGAPSSRGAAAAIPQLSLPFETQGGGPLARFDAWLERLRYESGINLTPELMFLIELCVGLALAGVIYLWRDNVIQAALTIPIGMTLVMGVYVLLRARRRKAILEQLPDVIDHVARTVRAGRTIDQALDMVGETAADPLGIEFRRCAGQLGMGLSVDAAMRAMARRVPIPEMRILTSTFVVQRQAGGNLPMILERLARVIRDRLSFHRQFRAATAGSRLSLIIIALSGPLMLLYMAIWREDYFNRFFESTIGMVMFGAAVAMYVAGLLWVTRILHEEY